MRLVSQLVEGAGRDCVSRAMETADADAIAGGMINEGCPGCSRSQWIIQDIFVVVEDGFGKKLRVVVLEVGGISLTHVALQVRHCHLLLAH